MHSLRSGGEEISEVKQLLYKIMSDSKNYIFARTDSSAIEEVLYDVAWSRLYIVLNGDRLYCYHDVPEQKVRELLSSPSIGHYFATTIVRYQYSALESDDPDYVQAMSSAIVEGAVKTSNGKEDSSSVQDDGVPDILNGRTTQSAIPQGALVQREMPFFFGPLPNRELYPKLVNKVQSTFREVIKNYECPLDVASSEALKCHKALIPFLPDNSVNYVLQILQTLNVIISVVDPRKSKAGDCRLDSERRIAYITINENINRYKFLCVLLHEVSHALNHVRSSAHDEIWKCIYACLLADCYLYFPQKYRQELQWMMVHPPATTRSTNFNGAGVLSGCLCDVPNCFQSDSIDYDAEKKEYPVMIQKYALHAVMTVTRMFLEDDDIYLINHCAGRLARASIRKAIENCDDVLSSEVVNIKRIIKCRFEEDYEKFNPAIQRLSDMLVRCWVLYNPLSVMHTGSFKKYYRGGNPWIDELINLVLLK